MSDASHDTHHTPETGIVASDPERLVLKPFWLRLRRRRRVHLIALLLGTAAVVVAGVGLLFQPFVHPLVLVGAWAAWAAVSARQVATETTLVVLRASVGVMEERRSVLTGRRRTRLVHRFREISAVELRSGPNPSALRPGGSPFAAPVLHHVVLHKDGRRETFWYTRFPEAAAHIARRMAELAGVPLIVAEQLAADESRDTAGLQELP